MKRRFLLLAAVLGAAILGLRLLVPSKDASPAPSRAAPSFSDRPASAPGTVTRPPATPPPSAAVSASPPATAPAAFNPADFPIVAALNAPGSTITRDLDVLQQLFDAWRTNFPREGNPVGENADITAALLGENRLGLALIPRGHPALNARGELCDRWGTPFRFHQLSGERMEVRSAGPDRRFATDDDALWTPQ